MLHQKVFVQVAEQVKVQMAMLQALEHQAIEHDSAQASGSAEDKVGERAPIGVFVVPFYSCSLGVGW